MRLFGGDIPGPQEIQGVQISTAVNALPTPICYGTPRAGANLIWLNGFSVTNASNVTQGKGGKNPAEYVYNAWIIEALCEGPVGEPFIKFIDGVAFAFDFSYYTETQTISAFQFQNGDYAQEPEPDIVDQWPAQALAYRGVAYCFGGNYRIDPTATVPQLNFVLPGFLTATCPLNNSTITVYVSEEPFGNVTVNLGFADADPASCISDILTNPIYGVGFPANLIDGSLFSSYNASIATIGDAAYQTYCQAIGIGFSVCLDTAESASSILGRWCDLTNTAPVWTGTTLKFIPYGDQPVSGNPGWAADNPGGIPLKYFVPNLTPIYALDDDDFKQTNRDTDPITIDRKDVADIYNTVRLSFRDRNNAWSMNVSEAKDENHIELYGIRVDNLAEAKEFTLSNYAAISAQLRVQRNVAVDRTYTFELSWAYCLLEPMDVVTVTDVTIGLNNQPVRIIEIEENDHMTLSVKAEVLAIGAGTAVMYPKQVSAPSTIYYPGAAPSPVNVPFIFEPTAQMLAALSQVSPTVVIGLSGGQDDTADPNWGGAQVYISLTETGTYTYLGTITGASRMGVLTAQLNSYGGSNPDNTNTLAVDLNESGATLDTVTSQQAATGLPSASLCAVINQSGELEILSYTTATLTGTGLYNLTGLYRGLYGTTANEANATTSQFLRIDPGTFDAPLPPQFVGQTLWAKFVSINIAGFIASTLADSTAYSFSPSGTGFVYFPVSGSIAGKPTSSEVIFSYVFGQTITFPANLDGSQGLAATGATLLTTFEIQQNGSNVGTMVFAASGSSPEMATFTMASATTFNPGDQLTIVAPASPDATLASISWTLLGQTF